MPYLDGREPIKTITSFGKVREGNAEEKFTQGAISPNRTINSWVPHAPLAKPRLEFGKTHPDIKVSQVREKSQPGFIMRISNLFKGETAIPHAHMITTFGKPSPSTPLFPNYPQSQFHTQSVQIQNRRGSTIGQQKKDGNVL